MLLRFFSIPSVRIFILVALTLAPAACQTVPGTGRSQLNVMSIGTEMSLGSQGYTEAMRETRVITSGADAEMVQRIGQRIATAAEKLYPESIASRCRWQFNLIDDDKMVNAWAMPGGGCAVYTGIMPIAETENGLAIILGHEVAHVIARHGGERMSHNTVLTIGMIGAQIKMRDMNHRDRTLMMAAIGGFATVGVMLPFSRSHESEADELGLYLAAAAGYDPREAIPVWERMAKEGGGRGLEFFSTHPHPSTRIDQFKELMPKALDYFHQSQSPNSRVHSDSNDNGKRRTRNR
ncbi:MAG: M48 family metallopeptidase [Planctomycetes bacterium]|jgi:predicted Zn-dependent protease|nr:M48 family metallopeptidase [Planctomycetota bacterium]MBT4029328.1 M48 family metallopeptidase [Planctomycetota bacterium]MBT4560813.1 M48 family metallopeptidase [Planctomycetota bacterium]MBT5100321.1 M48 family metallopeptidase [Planctomycetota bacterium]MBT5119355.1 M48 family metallopeptidase [Planctomycetota bacterium]